MSLATPSQSVSHKRFHQCVNHKKKLSLRHPLPTFGSFSFFFRHQLDSGLIRYILQKLTKSYKNELRHLFQYCILIPRKCQRKTPCQHTVPSPLRYSKSHIFSETWHKMILGVIVLNCLSQWFLSVLSNPLKSRIPSIYLENL